MSQYGILLPGYWDGETGRAIAQYGGSDAQLVGLYFTANKDATMIGLYQARLKIVQERIGTLTARKLERAIIALGQAGFADYDAETEHVWVREMAKYRLGLQKGPLDRKDNRAIGAAHLFDRLIPNPFLKPFFVRYREDLHLSRPRPFKGTWKPLGRPLQAPSKPVTGTETEDRSQEQRDLEQRDQDPRAPRARLSAFDAQTTHESHRVLLKCAHDILDMPDAASVDESELMARVKELAATRHISYDGRAAGRALDAARGERSRRLA